MKKQGMARQLTAWTQNAIRSLCKAVIVLATVAGGLLILLDLGQFFFKSSDFTVKIINVEGNEKVTQEEIQARSSIAPGTNIWMVDLDALRKRLEEHPAIRNVAVLRYPPHRLHIAIEERKPLAFVLNAEDGRFYGVDRDGVLFQKMIDPADAGMADAGDFSELLAYPVLSGIKNVEFALGKPIADLRAVEAFDFLRRLREESAAVFSEMVELELKDSGNVALHPRRRVGVFVLREMRSPQLEKKIAALWDAMEKEDLRAVYVDARFPDQGFAVRWDEAIGDRWKNLYQLDVKWISSG